jgi:hypothetical protein
MVATRARTARRAIPTNFKEHKGLDLNRLAEEEYPLRKQSEKLGFILQAVQMNRNHPYSENLLKKHLHSNYIAT